MSFPKKELVIVLGRSIDVLLPWWPPDRQPDQSLFRQVIALTSDSIDRILPEVFGGLLVYGSIRKSTPVASSLTWPCSILSKVEIRKRSSGVMIIVHDCKAARPEDVGILRSTKMHDCSVTISLQVLPDESRYISNDSKFPGYGLTADTFEYRPGEGRRDI